MRTSSSRAAAGPVIVTDGETRAALACVRSLGARGLPVHVLAVRPPALAGASRFATRVHAVPDAEAAPEAWAEAVRPHRCGASWCAGAADHRGRHRLALRLRGRSRGLAGGAVARGVRPGGGQARAAGSRRGLRSRRAPKPAVRRPRCGRRPPPATSPSRRSRRRAARAGSRTGAGTGAPAAWCGIARSCVQRSRAGSSRTASWCRSSCRATAKGSSFSPTRARRACGSPIGACERSRRAEG